jgi:hypothetical protein
LASLSALAGLLLSALLSRLLAALAGLLPRLLLSAATLLAALTATLILVVGALVVRIHQLAPCVACDATTTGAHALGSRRHAYAPAALVTYRTDASVLHRDLTSRDSRRILDLRLLVHDRFGDLREGASVAFSSRSVASRSMTASRALPPMSAAPVAWDLVVLDRLRRREQARVEGRRALKLPS